MEECSLEVLWIEANYQGSREHGFGFHNCAHAQSNSDLFHEIGPSQTTVYMKADPPLIPTVQTISFCD